MHVFNRSVPALTLALAGIFFGIAAYINLAEQPARLALSAGPMLAQWKISFAAGIAIQGALAIVTGLAGLLAWWLNRDARWMIGGLLMLANWPWTLVMIAPVNAALNATAPEAASATSMGLIAQWGQLHTVRTALGLCAVLIFIWAMSRDHKGTT
jgi:hypothetical protein